MLGVVLASATFVAAASRETDEQLILKAVGRNDGFCVVLGCGSLARPSLPVQLAASSKMLVHGIAFDNEALLRAGGKIDSAGVRGRCAVEKIPVAPLPYAPDLANLVVIEDPAALKALGVTTDEVLNITAPGGMIFTFENGAWRSRVKVRPSGMGDWMHPAGSPDGKQMSSDSLLALPIGLRWMDGVPMNFLDGGWASCRALVTAGGRCFTLGPTEYENLDVQYSKHKSDLWLTAHDAFNGLPLWKVNCGVAAEPRGLHIGNYGPLTTDGACVYTYSKNGVIEVDNSTGKILRTIPVKSPAARLVLIDGVLISAGWELDKPAHEMWNSWLPKTGAGFVQAFEAKTGTPLWEKELAPQNVLADKGVLFLLTTGSHVKTGGGLEAVQARSGKSLWTVNAGEFENDITTSLGLVSDGVVVVCREVAGAAPGKHDGFVSVYSVKDGRKMWELPKGTTTGRNLPSMQVVMIQGYLWVNGQAYHSQTGQPMIDPTTGQPVKNLPLTGAMACTPCTVVDNGRMIFDGRRMSGYVRNANLPAGTSQYHPFTYRAARGHCVQGIVPANGMVYAAQNSCFCTPGCLPGLLGFGPCLATPEKSDFQAVRPLEKGPAFSAAMNETSAGDGWPMFLADEARDSTTAQTVPERLNILWQQPVAAALSGPLANAWASRLRSTLTPPVVDGNILVTAAIEEGRVVALSAADGRVLWRFDVGARIESAPTLHRGRCFFGSRNGWLYALDLATGKLAWRLRMAPQERRMVAFGQVESVWPALGSVLAHNGIIYGTAGENTETDGGLAVLAIDAKTGRQLWAENIGAGAERSNDLLQLMQGEIVWRHYHMNAETGKGTTPIASNESMFTLPFIYTGNLEGRMDESWTIATQRRSGGPEALRMSHLTITTADNVYGLGVAIKKEGAEKFRPGSYPDSIYLWKKKNTGLIPYGMALASNALVFAGKSERKESVGGYLELVSPSDGSTIAQLELPSPVIHQGIAIARGQIFLALRNGTVACFGRKP